MFPLTPCGITLLLYNLTSLVVYGVIYAFLPRGYLSPNSIQLKHCLFPMPSSPFEHIPQHQIRLQTQQLKPDMQRPIQ